MKFLVFLAVLLFVSCGAKETPKMTRAEQWKLLEEAFLFQDQKSQKLLEELQKNTKKPFFLGQEKNKVEEEWRSVKTDFFLDHGKIIEAIDSLKNYKVLESFEETPKRKEILSNGMEIEYTGSSVQIYFPKEESNFRWMTSFPIVNTEASSFQGKEVGGSINPLEVEISFSDADYDIIFLQSSLSERAWESIFFLSIAYYNDFILRNSFNIKQISTPKERKDYEL